MKEFFKTTRNDKTLLFGFSISLILLLVTLFYLLLSYRNLPPVIPLFNQLPWGFARLGTKQQVFIPFSLGFFILVINYLFSMDYYHKNPLLSRLFCLTAALVSFLLFLFVLRTIRLII